MLEFESLEAAEAHLVAAGFKLVGVADWLRADDSADGGIYEVESTAPCDIALRSFRGGIEHEQH